MTVISRAAWGARPPTNPPAAISPWGPAIHWEGTRLGVRVPGEYAGIVRGIQRFHMETKGWNDIAYNALVSPHGQVFEGRGRNVRSAANGSSAGNAGWVAICYIAGVGDPFTEAGKKGVVEAAVFLGVADGGWTVHHDHVPTACPGGEITAWVRAGHPIPVPTIPKEDDLTPEQDARLTYIEGLEKANNEALARMEIAIRDKVGGIGAKLDAILKRLDAQQ